MNKGKPKYTKNLKVKKFKLTDEEKGLLQAKEDELKAMVVQEIESHIKKLVERVEELNSNKSSGDNNSTKKNVVLKLRKFKKDLKDEAFIKRKVDMLKLKRRKLKALTGRVEEKLDKLKLAKVRCFKCRRRGHTVSDCKFTDVVEEDGEEATQEVEKVVPKKEKKSEPAKKLICYNCGSTDHGLYACTLPVDHKNLPYAECFVCKGKGHISANCPQSDKGIFIYGGSCYVCHAKDHLAKNCPQKQIQLQEQKKDRPKRKFEKKEENKGDGKEKKERTFLQKKRRAPTGATGGESSFKRKPRIFKKDK
jgi:zinc finger CCHC domain-containing protein 9